MLVIALVPIAAGLMTMAAGYVRRGDVAFSDLADGMRRGLGKNLLLGTGQLILTAVLAADLVVGLSIGGLWGSFLAVAAFYGLMLLWVLAIVAWPLIVDPERRDEPLRWRLRLAALLVLARPLRLLGVGVVLAAFLVVSALFIPALLVFSVALAWLVAAHYVLPTADHLEGRATLEVEE